MATVILVGQLNTYCVGDHFLTSELLDGNSRGCWYFLSQVAQQARKVLSIVII